MNARISKLALAIALTALASGSALAQGNAGTNARSSYSDVFAFADGMPQAGASSTLIRNSRGVSFSAQAAGLEPEAAYTVWWIIFNNPSACVDGCGEDDLFAPAVDASVAWATGRVSDGHGFASFDAHLLRGGETAGQLLFGPGLISNGAEIHLVFRSHGAAANLTDEQLQEALTTVGGGCGVNVCDDTHFAVHLP